MAGGTTGEGFAALVGQKYINLTTFRRDGSPVTTPVWFTSEGELLYITTYDGTGKVKRLRANERVEIAASDARGKARGPVLAACGRWCRIRARPRAPRRRCAARTAGNIAWSI